MLLSVWAVVLYCFALFVLAIDQMRAVLDELPRIALWKEFGRNLGIDEEQLNVIEVDIIRTHGRLSKVIEHWLKRNHNERECGPPTWGNLAKAIKPIDKALAMKIEAKHAVCQGKEHTLHQTGSYMKDPIVWLFLPFKTISLKPLKSSAINFGHSPLD